MSNDAAWRARLIATVPRDEIPGFLTDLQALVAALREGREWEPLLTAVLRRRSELVLDAVGPHRHVVADALAKRP